MKLNPKERNKISTMASKNEIELPKEIRDAVLNGYDVYVTRCMRDGVLSAKITFHKVKVAGTKPLDKQDSC